MRGVTKGIVSRYEYGSKADGLKKEYNEIFHKYRRTKRAIIFETDNARKKNLNKQLELYNKQLDVIKNKITKILKEK